MKRGEIVQIKMIINIVKQQKIYFIAMSTFTKFSITFPTVGEDGCFISNILEGGNVSKIKVMKIN